MRRSKRRLILPNLPINRTEAIRQTLHASDAARECSFAAPRRTKNRCDAFGRYAELRIKQNARERAVEGNLNIALLGFFGEPAHVLYLPSK